MGAIVHLYILCVCVYVCTCIHLFYVAHMSACVRVEELFIFFALCVCVCVCVCVSELAELLRNYGDKEAFDTKQVRLRQRRYA